MLYNLRYKLLVAVLAIVLVITFGGFGVIGHVDSVYGYTQEQVDMAKAWLSSHGYAPTRAGAEQAYQDYLNGMWTADGEPAGGSNGDSNGGSNGTGNGSGESNVSDGSYDSGDSGDDSEYNEHENLYFGKTLVSQEPIEAARVLLGLENDGSDGNGDGDGYTAFSDLDQDKILESHKKLMEKREQESIEKSRKLKVILAGTGALVVGIGIGLVVIVKRRRG